jgi:sulfatase maturation enzyme AslB (radical SAM superfamily)
MCSGSLELNVTLQPLEQFRREYFDWAEDEFAKRFVEKVSAGRLGQNQDYVDLKLEKKSLGRKLQAAFQDVIDLPNLVKMLPGLPANPKSTDYVGSIYNFLKDNRSSEPLHWWRKLRQGTKTPLFGSADIINVCNLKCVHCYWWTNREPTAGELTPEQWRIVIRESFKKMKIANVTVVGGEPMLRKDVVQVFSEEMRNRMSVVTNGLFPFVVIKGLYFVSIDGTEEIHNSIRGPNTFAKIKKNVKTFADAGGTVNINMTLNTLNYKSVMGVIHEWEGIAGRISIQFHTPFVDNDPLWLPFGEERNKTIDSILEYCSRQNKHFVINSKEQLELLRGNWGYKCPNWMILPLDYRGNIKTPCCMGSANEGALQPQCDKCGIAPYSGLLAEIFPLEKTVGN